MRNTITYRHWQPGDDDAILAFLPNTNEDWYRNKFDDPDIEPEGICLAFNDESVHSVFRLNRRRMLICFCPLVQKLI